MSIPPILSPPHWLSALDSLPRFAALAALVVFLSMLVVGLRYFHYYVLLLAMVGGWAGGAILAQLMHVRIPFVAGPTALMALAVVWPVRRYAAPFVVGITAACSVGTMVVRGFELDAFWVGFSAGLFIGVALAVLASRFAIAVFTSACGTLGVVATLGAVVRASEGWLSPGGYWYSPMVYVVAGPITFVVALVVQVSLEPDAPPDGIEDG